MSAPSVESAVAKIMAARYQPKVGDRVKIRVDGECFRTTVGESSPGILDGKIGTVDLIREPSFRAGHYIGVRLEAPVLGYHKAGVWACPGELEQVDSQLPLVPTEPAAQHAGEGES